LTKTALNAIVSVAYRAKVPPGAVI